MALHDIVMLQPPALDVEPFPCGFGAYVRDVRLQDLTPDHGPGVLDALHHHQVLVFESQSLSATEYSAFARILGPPEPHVLAQFHLPDAPEIYVISNIVENGRRIGYADGGYEWHTDMAFAEFPMAYTMLYTREAPPAGADTVFASTYTAYEALPETERQRLRGLDVIHSIEKLYEGRAEQPSEATRKKRPDVVHPLVRTHPATGRDGLYLGIRQTRNVTGLDEAQSDALISGLVEMITTPEQVYRHKWKVGDVVVWDNRGLLHAATPYDQENNRRLVWRISIRGERPFRASQA
jgi:taurine dioxygenase